MCSSNNSKDSYELFIHVRGEKYLQYTFVLKRTDISEDYRNGYKRKTKYKLFDERCLDKLLQLDHFWFTAGVSFEREQHKYKSVLVTTDIVDIFNYFNKDYPEVFI